MLEKASFGRSARDRETPGTNETSEPIWFCCASSRGSVPETPLAHPAPVLRAPCGNWQDPTKLAIAGRHDTQEEGPSETTLARAVVTIGIVAAGGVGAAGVLPQRTARTPLARTQAPRIRRFIGKLLSR